MIKAIAAKYAVPVAAGFVAFLLIWVFALKVALGKANDSLAECQAAKNTCKAQNIHNEAEVDKLVGKLRQCIGENEAIQEQSMQAVIDLTHENQRREQNLQAVIDELENEQTDCDHVVYGPRITSLWAKARNRKD